MSSSSDQSSSRLAKFRQRWTGLVQSLRTSASPPSPPVEAATDTASTIPLSPLSVSPAVPAPVPPAFPPEPEPLAPAIPEAIPLALRAEIPAIPPPGRSKKAKPASRPRPSARSKAKKAKPAPIPSTPAQSQSNQPALAQPAIDLTSLVQPVPARSAPSVAPASASLDLTPPVVPQAPSPLPPTTEPPIVDTIDFADTDFFAIFIEEVESHLPTIRRGLAALPGFDFSSLPELYRSFHTLKGAFGQIGAMRGRALFHTLEGFAEDLELAPDAPAQQAYVTEKFPLIQGVWDALETLIDGLEHKTCVPIPPLPASVLAILSPALLHTLALEKATRDLALSSPSPAPSSPESSSSSPVSSSPAPEEQFIRLSTGYLEKVLAKISSLKTGNLVAQNQLQASLGLLRSLDDTGDKLSHLLREFEIYTDYRLQYLNDASQLGGGELDTLEFERFNRFQELTKFITEGVADFIQAKRNLQQLLSSQETVLQAQRETAEEVHHGFIDARLVSISHILRGSLDRTVRQASTELGKPVNFIFQDSNLEADKVLLERLSAPLAHLLRNSLTHGIEDGPTRLAQNKPSLGQISVSFSQVGEQIQVVIRDDGAGLNLEAIKNKAVAKNLWDAARPLDVTHAADIICTPGFSTAATISELAGRGVGMDVVRNAVLELGGQFTLTSETGLGMQVTILVPLTFSSLRGLTVTVSDRHYFIPAKSIAWLDSLLSADLQAARSAHVLSRPSSPWDALVSPTHPSGSSTWEFSPLSTLVGSSAGSPSSDACLDLASPARPVLGSAFVLGFAEAERRLAIEVDGISPLQDLPLYSLGKLWSSFPGVLGTTVLPSGELVYVLDVLHLANGSLSTRPPASSTSSSAPASTPLPAPILIVDDSLTVRAHLQHLLSTHRFSPSGPLHPTILAQDGVEALDYLQAHPTQLPAAIILDVEMPRMDGFELVRQIKASPALRDIPLLMVTSKVSARHRDYGLSLGVAAYLGKPVKKSELLPALDKLVIS